MPRAKISYGLLTSQNQGGGGAKKQGLVNHVYWSRTPFRIFSANTNNITNNCISFKATSYSFINNGVISKVGLLFIMSTPLSNVSVGWYIEGPGLTGKVEITGSVNAYSNVISVVITSSTTAYPGLTSNSEYTFYIPECIE